MKFFGLMLVSNWRKRARSSAVLIFDETCTLRAGYHGMQGIYGVRPDLTVMGKIIGGGVPIGAVGGSKEVMEVLEKATSSKASVIVEISNFIY